MTLVEIKIKIRLSNARDSRLQFSIQFSIENQQSDKTKESKVNTMYSFFYVSFEVLRRPQCKVRHENNEWNLVVRGNGNFANNNR